MDVLTVCIGLWMEITFSRINDSLVEIRGNMAFLENTRYSVFKTKQKGRMR